MKGIVLDANILVRAVLGQKVRRLLEKYEDTANFYSPDICFDEAQGCLPAIFKNKNLNSKSGFIALEQIGKIVQPIKHSLYGDHEHIARQRVELRDENDWPVAAVALLFDLPIWTEDKDFFGSGIATWTTDRVEIYLRH